jgi:hypothetical protein
MQRIPELVAGISGCENGTVSAVIRGTSTPAVYYTDFEGTSSATATNVALDQHGGKVMFFDRLVTLTAYSSGGSIVRTWTAGDDAGAVELKSQSFIGTSYSGGVVAAGNPTTVEAAMDKWLDSAGATDFKVMVNAVATDLDTAFTAVAGLRYYVVTNSIYGAVGNGVANDLSAIQAAINAANAAGGGVVFFPPGTYLVNGTLTSYSTVSLLGYNKSLTSILVQSSSASLASGVSFAQVENLKINFTAADYTGDLFVATTSAVTVHSNVEIEQPVVSGTYFYSTAGASLDLRNCFIYTKSVGEVCNSTIATVPSGTFGAYDSMIGFAENVAMSGVSVTAGAMKVMNTTFTGSPSAAGGTKTAFYGAGIFVNGLVLNGPTTGVLTVFDVATAAGYLQEHGFKQGTTWIGNSNTVVLYGAGVSGSSSFSSLSTLTARDKVSKFMSGDTEPFTCPGLQARHVTVRVGSAAGWAGNAQVVVSTAPEGSDLILSFWNDTAGALTFEWSTGVNVAAATTFSVTANSTRTFHLVSRLNAASALAWFLVGATGGAEVVE